MKKVCVLALIAVVLTGVVSAADMKVGVKGTAGVDNSGNEGVLIGGGIDVAYSFSEHFGIAVEADACGADVTWNDGLTLKDNFYLSVPVMLTYRYELKNLELGAGAGISTIFRQDRISIGLGSGLNATWWVRDFGIRLGVTGTLDCLPTLEAKANDDGSKTYHFKKSEGKDSSLLCSLGVVYSFAPKAN